MKRDEILAAALRCVSEEREQQYGAPEDNFGVIAAMWEAYLAKVCVAPGADIRIDPGDVAILLALMKVARIATTNEDFPKPDSFVDLCGYAALAGEILTEDE